METNDKLLSMLGLCKKAGRLLQGSDRVVEATRAGKVALILVASDSSKGTLRRIQFVAEETETPFRVIPATIAELGAKTGKAAGIVGIADHGFARATLKLLAAQ